jgi:hypothetical protein
MKDFDGPFGSVRRGWEQAQAKLHDRRLGRWFWSTVVIVGLTVVIARNLYLLGSHPGP